MRQGVLAGLLAGGSIWASGCGPACEEEPCEGDPEATPTATPAPEPYIDAVTRFEPGEGAGFGQDRFPQVVLGPPVGTGTVLGSTDVLSLGVGGVIEIEFTDLLPVDGEGIDLIVFEIAFYGGGTAEGVWAEPAAVSVSEDGEVWSTFPCEPEEYPYTGCAGVSPVFANEGTGVSALDPAVAGGDAFDLATVGVPRVRFVRIQDSGLGEVAAPASGFDLDAIAVIHSERASRHEVP